MLFGEGGASQSTCLTVDEERAAEWYSCKRVIED